MSIIITVTENRSRKFLVQVACSTSSTTLGLATREEPIRLSCIRDRVSSDNPLDLVQSFVGASDLGSCAKSHQSHEIAQKDKRWVFGGNETEH